jgi:hypothetical protein
MVFKKKSFQNKLLKASICEGEILRLCELFTPVVYPSLSFLHFNLLYKTSLPNATKHGKSFPLSEEIQL